MLSPFPKFSCPSGVSFVTNAIKQFKLHSFPPSDPWLLPHTSHALSNPIKRSRSVHSADSWRGHSSTRDIDIECRNQSGWFLSIVSCLPSSDHLVSSQSSRRSAVLAGQMFPGPVIRGQKGDRFQLNVVNNLDDSTMERSTSVVCLQRVSYCKKLTLLEALAWHFPERDELG